MENEKWTVINGFENYEISNLGNVRNTKKNKLMKPCTDKDGYITVMLSKRKFRKLCKIHRLVAQAFIPNPENKPLVNHINSNRGDNNVLNLEWCTPTENIIHGINHGNISKEHLLKLAIMGQKASSKRIKVKTLYNGKVKEFESSAEASRYYGFTRKYFTNLITLNNGKNNNFIAKYC